MTPDIEKLTAKLRNDADVLLSPATLQCPAPNLSATLIEAADALASLVREREWQPIETAPRDGTKFLAWWAHGVHTCRWGNGPYDRKTKRYVGGWSIGMARDAKPSHWQQFPSPPARSLSSERREGP